MLTCRNISLEDDLDWEGLVVESSTASFFQTKEWLKLWVKHFDGEVKIIGIFGGQNLVGIAPLEIKEGEINFLGVTPVLGGELVSDFGDIIAISGREKEVWNTVLSYIKDTKKVILGSGSDSRIDSGQARMTKVLELNLMREDSPSFKMLQEFGGRAEEIDVAPYIALPNTWEEYLTSLDRHDRHELRRKMKKMEAEGVIKVCDEINTQNINDFFRLMIASNENKRKFLSVEMKNFFSEVIGILGHKQLLTLCFLRYENVNIASILLMYQKNEVLLYNSGFDPKYSFLSPGLILNAYAIRGAIEEGKDKFDFLRGGEKYKYDLGGKKRNLYKISF